MKFVVDQQLPPTLAAWLRSKGHEAIHVREIGLRSAPDREIWRYAEAHSCVVVTKDEDFFVLAKRAAGIPQVVWLRVGNLMNADLIARLDADWVIIFESLEAGAPVVQVR